jgi:glycerophosphoryl diester phosphodiesterase
MKKLIPFLFIILSLSVYSQSSSNIDIQGHRGSRGWLPENTIPSFIKAIELGSNTIELDVVISKDGKIVVSHEPWFSHKISLDPSGKSISAEAEKDFNIFKLDYAEIAKFDVGSMGNIDFPYQKKMKVYKPLLSEVFKAVSKYTKKNKLNPMRFNIEIKSSPQGDGLFHPEPKAFAKMVFDEVIKYKQQNHVIVQSFDVRPLQELNKYPTKLPLALLVMNKDGVAKNTEKLGFVPTAYSPHFSLIDVETVEYCHANKMKIIPWTVNEVADLERMKTFALDGIITDYPDRAVNVFRK